MSSNEPVRVEQCDRDAVMGMLNYAFRNAPDDCTEHVEFDDIAEAFARHRTLSQADGQKLLERYGKALMADMT